MKKINSFLGSQLFLIGLSLVFLSSCVTQRQVKYLQRKQQNDTTSSYLNPRTSDYKIQSHDNLYIKVFNLDEKSYFYFNKNTSTSGNSSGSSDMGFYLDSYVVNDSGYIDFPLIGKIFVKDLKIDEAKNLVQSLINEYLKDVIVTLKLVSFNVTLLGEVKMPGVHKFYQDKLNIFEAISLAGDLTEFANRQRVALIRQTKEGSRVIYINLNSINILRSQYYYLEPNDILYFAPLGIKRWGSETFPWGTIFTVISTALLLIDYFRYYK